MQATLVLFALSCTAAALAAPQFAAPAASQVYNPNTQPALSRTEQHDEAGQYSLSYSTYEGINVNERGLLKQTPDGSDYVLVKDGSYTYVSPDGTPVQVTYTADENGYHPQSANIPVAPQPQQPSFF